MSSPAAGTVGLIYLLHFDGALHHAQHYLGWTSRPLDERALEHILGQGSPLVAAAIAAGCSVDLARTWSGTREEERELKDRHNARGLCPRCRPVYNERAKARMAALRLARKGSPIS